MAITPIQGTRVSDQLVRQRLLTQLGADQLDLFRLQNALSTGIRISAPSEDAPAAQRAMGLQSLLERKEQVKVNLQTSQTYLSATDAALSGVSGMLAQIRGDALSVSDSTSSSTGRRAVAEQVDRALTQLVDVGNQRFRGRYLFGGTHSSDAPYSEANGMVRFGGNEGEFLSYSDIDVLFATNLPGNSVLGGLAENVRGTVDLNPLVTADTRLSDLHGGRGITVGSIAISDGTNTQLIDISNVETVGDLQDLLEANPPLGNILNVTITNTGIDVTLTSGALTIKEVGNGTTAAELGILATTGQLPPTVTGTDLDPRLSLTTRIADLGLATPLDTAAGLQIKNGGLSHTVLFNTAVTIEDLLNALNGSHANVLAQLNSTRTGIDIRSRLSGSDFAIGENGGTTAADLGMRTFTRSLALADLNYGYGVHTADKQDDLGTFIEGGNDFQIRLDDGTTLNFNLDLSTQRNVGDVIDLINAGGGGLVTARLATFGNGIELVASDTTAGANFAVIKLNSSQAAEDLGLIPVGQSQSSPATVAAGTETITGRDVHPLEVPGVFTALARLRDALHADDTRGIQRGIELLDQAAETVNFGRAELGARQQGLDILQTRLDSEQVTLESSLSLEIDTDFAATVSEMLARQTAYQASLQLTSRTFQLTLLDYL